MSGPKLNDWHIEEFIILKLNIKLLPEYSACEKTFYWFFVIWEVKLNFTWGCVLNKRHLYGMCTSQ